MGGVSNGLPSQIQRSWVRTSDGLPILLTNQVSKWKLNRAGEHRSIFFLWILYLYYLPLF